MLLPGGHLPEQQPPFPVEQQHGNRHQAKQLPGPAAAAPAHKQTRSDAAGAQKNHTGQRTE